MIYVLAAMAVACVRSVVEHGRLNQGDLAGYWKFVAIDTLIHGGIGGILLLGIAHGLGWPGA